MAARDSWLPPPVSRPWLAVAGIAWIAAWAFTLLTEPAPLEPGRVSGEGVLVTDPIQRRHSYRAVVSTELGDVRLDLDEPDEMLRGSRVSFDGTADGPSGRIGAQRYRGTVDVDHIEVIDAAPVLFDLGERVRRRVGERLEPAVGGRALLAGFLIGDTSGLSRAEEEAMRRAGLSHFVAVSGSNVALFVGLLVVLAGPLALGPRRRALVGLLGLPVYAAATRFEPSVMRASVMAGMALGGRLLGVVFEAWQLLSLAVIVLVSVQPTLTLSAGFQLSVVATAGVLVGARWPVKGGRIGRALAVTLGAQIAVAPLILLHFGSVPLLSPLVNLLAAPVVAASTMVGALGVIGPGLLLDVAAFLADVVLWLAAGSEIWPQLGVGQFVTLFVCGVIAAGWPRARSLMVVAGSIVLVFGVLGLGAGAPDASVVVLDVGQGDAILIHGGDDRYALVDGGPDELVLLDRLRAHGVDHLDLVVLTHVHADHATGLVGLLDRMPVGQAWVRTEPHETAASAALFESLRVHGVATYEPSPGERIELGVLTLRVEGPRRRYASPNDQSIVLMVEGPARDMLLAGDIEVVAQQELDHLRADVLKVPHQGAATSDPEWLSNVGSELAVISVGPNQFGHPVDWVIALLEESGAEVLRTDQEGDIVVPLG
jgi:competence protein ComEC